MFSLYALTSWWLCIDFVTFFTDSIVNILLINLLINLITIVYFWMNFLQHDHNENIAIYSKIHFTCHILLLLLFLSTHFHSDRFLRFVTFIRYVTVTRIHITSYRITVFRSTRLFYAIDFNFYALRISTQYYVPLS